MFTLESPSQYRCQCCDSVLQTAPEYECSEWFRSYPAQSLVKAV
jgi:hypothetical protein